MSRFNVNTILGGGKKLETTHREESIEALVRDRYNLGNASSAKLAEAVAAFKKANPSLAAATTVKPGTVIVLPPVGGAAVPATPVTPVTPVTPGPVAVPIIPVIPVAPAPIGPAVPGPVAPSAADETRPVFGQAIDLSDIAGALARAAARLEAGTQRERTLAERVKATVSDAALKEAITSRPATKARITAISTLAEERVTTATEQAEAFRVVVGDLNASLKRMEAMG